ncbi:hypothetical protein QQX10_10620 [Demequina sp. SYSU T00039]|uniref:Uncharacterized protein n=1 Tax=Demequina lignilytica TaxID=3051663 RepID=A0AAW7M514_9MICO|nr:MULTISPECIES: hypothetical protein [unclassified Demequina]MDN4478642.1 hypothetical protein [Demequina sp. SYSU T00039-1]MDN4488620.1 hypothetical protein [Demequina sp. SYSU T00039]
MNRAEAHRVVARAVDLAARRGVAAASDSELFAQVVRAVARETLGAPVSDREHGGGETRAHQMDHKKYKRRAQAVRDAYGVAYVAGLALVKKCAAEVQSMPVGERVSMRRLVEQAATAKFGPPVQPLAWPARR